MSKRATVKLLATNASPPAHAIAVGCRKALCHTMGTASRSNAGVPRPSIHTPKARQCESSTTRKVNNHEHAPTCNSSTNTERARRSTLATIRSSEDILPSPAWRLPATLEGIRESSDSSSEGSLLSSSEELTLDASELASKRVLVWEFAEQSSRCSAAVHLVENRWPRGPSRYFCTTSAGRFLSNELQTRAATNRATWLLIFSNSNNTLTHRGPGVYKANKPVSGSLNNNTNNATSHRLHRFVKLSR
mmetsp:Transcript_69185/g.200747  ORF Transcript_69185/g.200747 Transcript_69185/m.200747 type:complete len:247 (-) Transcript_69185:407-1147(-)